MDNTKINENIESVARVVEQLTVALEGQQKTIDALRLTVVPSAPVVNLHALRDSAINRILEKGSMDKEAFLQVATLLSGEAAELAITERVIDRIEGMIPKLLALKAASVDPEVAELERRVRLQQLRKQLAPEPVELVGRRNGSQ
jgi:hypothetical protein